MASGGDVTARLCDLAIRQATTVLTSETTVTSAALSPDGGTLAVPGADGTMTLWAFATGQFTTLTGCEGQLEAMAFSPDGRTLASSEWQPPDLIHGSTEQGGAATLRLWDLATGQTTAILTPRGGYVVFVTFSPDGRTLATASLDRTVRLWDPATGQPTATLFGHTELVTSAAFSTDGRTLATGSRDGTVRLWTPGESPR